MKTKLLLTVASTAIALSITAPMTFAGAVHDANLFTDSTLAANDDSSTGATSIGFNVDFFGTTYSNLYVNNNGNVTFNGAEGTFTPFGLLSTSTPIIAPFFGDVDTRGSGSGLVQYGQDTLGGHSVFGVNWFDVNNGVGYYSSQTNLLNIFQLILTDRSDIALGDFDFEFNYGQIQWETGGASGGVGGLGGNSARAGWSNGLTSSYEIAGSAINGALLDSNLVTGLISNRLNSNTDGQYIFSVRNGVVQDNNTVPEPETVLLIGIGLFGLFVSRKQRGTFAA